MTLRFERPAPRHEQQYLDMMREWTAFGGRLNPGALRNEGRPYDVWLGWVKDAACQDNCPPGMVPMTLYFALDETGCIVGAVTLRHYLNDFNFQDGGHMGYGVRPTERKKGYATQILAWAVKQLREMGETDILVTCAADNEGSRCTILKNGGVLENEIIDEHGETVQRYWIKSR